MKSKTCILKWFAVVCITWQIESTAIQVTHFNHISRLQWHDKINPIVLFQNIVASFCILFFQNYSDNCKTIVRPTSTRSMSPVFHKNGDWCLNMNLLYWRLLILSTIACPLLFHSIDLSSCFKQMCQNIAYHEHSTKYVIRHEKTVLMCT